MLGADCKNKTTLKKNNFELGVGWGCWSKRARGGGGGGLLKTAV